MKVQILLVLSLYQVKTKWHRRGKNKIKNKYLYNLVSRSRDGTRSISVCRCPKCLFCHLPHSGE